MTGKTDEKAQNCVRFSIHGNGWRTTMEVSPSGFKILRGSTVKPVCDCFRKSHYFPLREQLEADGVILGGEFTVDHWFRSAGQAGSVVASADIATGRAWVAEDGRTFAEVYPRGRSYKRDLANPTAGKREDEIHLGWGQTAEGTLTYTGVSSDGEWFVEWRGQPRFFPVVRVAVGA